MSDLAIRNIGATAAVEETTTNSQRVAASLKGRYAAERRFKAYGIAAISFALFCLVILLGTIVSNGYSAFVQTMVRLDITIYPQDIDPDGRRDVEVLSSADYQTPIRQAITDLFPEVQGRTDLRQLEAMISPCLLYTSPNPRD